MGESCKDCSKWAEDIYWAHFQTIRFSQTLLDDFDQELAVPKKFCNNLKKKLPDVVALKGPSGLLWTVGLTTKDTAVFFKHGWQEFVKDHSLKPNDLLVFRYNGESQFDVLMFDSENMCEKEASYFVRKYGHSKHENGCLTKRKSREISSEEMHASSKNGGCSVLEKSEDDPSIALPSEEQVITPVTDEKKVQSKTKSAQPTRSRRIAAKRGRPAGSVRLLNNTKDAPNKGSSGAYFMEYVSNRRPITEEEKMKAQQLAQEASSTSLESFMIIMRPNQVYKRFYMLLPSGWVSNHMALQNQDVILRIGKSCWRTKFTYNRTRRVGGITCGWKFFAVDNNLEEFDACVFEPGIPLSNTFVLDVKIFRVVEDFTPPTGTSSATPKGTKRKLIVPMDT
ncbi:B3 domain-containing protein REM16 [Ziziphus jujuba]|uniref:B3 domain-containing protein REM16 n=7 Tax=Ziziphus jujuba TaxID=326968 RepID=A0A6P6G854_ZIZJJ|nr:B3 domain-containing protein REM16 [Ziziphus jujuba]XP_015884748.3 B3 domain-containing protein REM16 [Ziziphus jujuba]XP_015884749.3 B3 domain-containing protein REM16 [Ziziphus jujuba]XP_015884750.3 B3 domain-containing protein REM16 [Ziziphus jujuba]XP_015884751.3 B3 domain-containing protein REM16 [Ziziphus jujuba]XP_015884752.3 B3 domain-containing protein REM16 [Ziziphus jujuba]XP_048331042.2 B3 domain-containing protein REM16 [Ziziphus jujuba]XP_048331043.2 B3 domain-containing pro